MITFIMYEHGYLGYALWYFRTIGFWGSLVVYAIPFILAVVQVGIEGYEVFPGTWSLVLMCFFGAIWIMSATIHIMYLSAFIAHVESQEPTNCICSIP